MTDNSDGTYSYTLRVDKEGTVTYRIMLTQTGVVTADYYKLSGTFLGTTQVSNIDFTYGGITVGDSIVYNGEYDYIRGEFRGLIKPPRSETYSFDLIKLDRGWIEIDGVSMIPGGSTYSESFTMAMDTNNVYSFYVSWEEDLSTAEIKLHWNETGSMAAVQSQYFILPDEVVNGNITIACQSGYAVQASDPSSCTYVCGDGILTSGETCDDRNIVSGDGCSSDCQTIENNYICVYNSGLPGHECSSCGTSGYPNTAKDACILCSSGYQHASSNLNTCTQICGDGIQVSGETCDDGNSLSDDGCSKECQVEEHYKCTGQPSVCKVDKIEAEQSVEAVGQAVSISISVGMTSQVALSFSLGQSPSSIWMLINISQILQYTAMLTLYFPKLLISSYRHLSIANFDISIFPNVFMTLFDKSLIEGRDSFDYRFANQNIESTNIFMNCGDVVFLLILFLFLNIIIALLSATCKACKCKKDSEDKRGF